MQRQARFLEASCCWLLPRAWHADDSPANCHFPRQVPFQLMECSLFHGKSNKPLVPSFSPFPGLQLSPNCSSCSSLASLPLGQCSLLILPLHLLPLPSTAAEQFVRRENFPQPQMLLSPLSVWPCSCHSLAKKWETLQARWALQLLLHLS